MGKVEFYSQVILSKKGFPQQIYILNSYKEFVQQLLPMWHFIVLSDAASEAAASKLTAVWCSILCQQQER